MKRLACLAVLAGCTNAPVDVSGTYTVALTNRDNGCNVQGYTVGAQSTGIPVVITQSGGAATVTVNGAAGLTLGLEIGTNVFTGTVDGNGIDVKATGTLAKSSGNCTYTYNSDIIATLITDALSGQVRYTAATNGNSDCATLQGCLTYQDFSGSRPPR